jgi:hypothetical protein
MSKPIVVACSMDASFGGSSIPSPWHANAVGGVHPITRPSHSHSTVKSTAVDPNRTFDPPWSLAKSFAETKPAKIYSLLDRPGLRPVRFKLVEEGTRAPFKGWETVRDALCCFRARSNLQRIDA